MVSCSAVVVFQGRQALMTPHARAPGLRRQISNINGDWFCGCL
jgi:hypothetical protein